MSFSEAFSWLNIQFLLEGLLITVEVAFYCIVFSIILGFILHLLFPDIQWLWGSTR